MESSGRPTFPAVECMTFAAKSAEAIGSCSRWTSSAAARRVCGMFCRPGASKNASECSLKPTIGARWPANPATGDTERLDLNRQ